MSFRLLRPCSWESNNSGFSRVTDCATVAVVGFAWGSRVFFAGFSPVTDCVGQTHSHRPPPAASTFLGVGVGTIYNGDALSVLKTLNNESVQCCVTSPPYWGLRDYGVEGQIGLEKSFHDWLDAMSVVFSEVNRVLKKDGTLWVNIGDTYLRQAGKGFNGNRRLSKADRSIGVKRPTFQKPKDLLGMPWRLAFRLQEDGWYLRRDIIWNKTNACPESVRDRPTTCHEYLFLLAKSERYYYDIDATREPHKAGSEERSRRGRGPGHKYTREDQKTARMQGFHLDVSRVCHPKGKNKRSVWSIPAKGFKGAHFATFPPALIEPCIKAGTRPGDVVLDPFFGAGTTGLVSMNLARDWIGIELNPDYCEIARERIGLDAHLIDRISEGPSEPGRA